MPVAGPSQFSIFDFQFQCSIFKFQFQFSIFVSISMFNFKFNFKFQFQFRFQFQFHFHFHSQFNFNFNFEIEIEIEIETEIDKIWHLACPASPIHYQHNPIKTSKTSFLGTYNMLNLAKKVNAKILLASSSEVYGEPEEHPQTESYK